MLNVPWENCPKYYRIVFVGGNRAPVVYYTRADQAFSAEI